MQSSAVEGRGWRERLPIARLLPIGGLLLATLVSYREILLPAWVLSDYDIWTYFYPLRAYGARALQEGRFPLWNPDTFLGAPFFANPQTSLLYPGTVLFYLLPLGYAYSLSVILHVGLAGVFMYAFLRRAWGLSRIAAFVGACGFAFGGFISSQIGHVNQLSASAWLPAIALCADAGFRLRSPRWAVAGAVALALQLLAGHAQESYMTVWVVGIVLLWRALVGTEPAETDGALRPALAESVAWRSSWSGLLQRGLTAAWVGALVLGCGFGLAAVQLVPTTELSSASIRGGGMSDAEAVSFSLPPTSLVRSVLPGYWFNLSSEEMGHVGAIGLGFAALGLVMGRWRPVLCATALAMVGIFFALGGANPLYVPLLHHVPGLGLFRVPSRWLFVYTFGASGLAALGVQWAFAHLAARTNNPVSPSEGASSSPNAWGKPQIIRASFAALALLAIVVVGLSWTTPVPGRIVALWLGGLVAAFVIAGLARYRPSPVTAGALALLVLVELVAAAMDLPQRYPAPSMVLDGSRPLPTYLLQHPPAGRILSLAPTEYPLEDDPELAARYPLAERGSFFFTSDLKLDEVMSPNVPLRYGLSTIDGYDGGVLPLRQFLRMASLLAPANEIRADGVLRTRLIAIPDAHLLKLFNIRAVIASQAIDPELDGVRYDVATARRVTRDHPVTLGSPALGARPTQQVALLGSVESPPGTVGTGRMVVSHTDGTVEELGLRLGTDLFSSTEPGPLRSPQPTAGLSRGGRMDSAVQIQLRSLSPIRSIEWRWDGDGVFELRAATLIAPDGAQEQLMLQPGLKRTLLPVMKVYEPEAAPSPAATLIRSGFIASDEEALQRMQAMSAEELDQTVLFAPETGLPPRISTLETAPTRFVRAPGAPERIVYRRTDGVGDGYLLVDDAWFPGWQAEIDGAPTPIYRANVGYRAVYVPAQAQTVVLTYAPRSVVVGAVGTLGSLAVALLLVFAQPLWARGRRPRAQSDR